MTESQLYTSFRILLRQLNNFSSNANNTLELANAIALQSEYSLLPTYLHIVKNRLKAEIFSINFQVKGKQAAEKINQWVNRKTRGKIDTILKGNPTADTRMVLLNALYFKGTWEHSFRKDKTKDMEFTYGKDKEVKVPMMNQAFEKLKYARFNEGELVELPYSGNTLSMLLFLPADTSTNSSSINDTISSTFAQAALRKQQESLEYKNRVNLMLPRFNISSSYSLKPALQSMGIEAAFDPDSANFGRMTNQKDLMVAEVLHKAVVEVNEQGTEAAAVSAMRVRTRSRRNVVYFNRPFLFAIRYNRLQLTLFAGIVNKP